MVCGLMLFLDGAANAQQQPGSVRGVVRDRDFDVPLAGALVSIVETGQRATTAELGNYVFPEVAPGRYTLIFSKDGYVRQVRADVEVTSGQLTSVDIALAGEFTEMDEFVVQDILAAGAGTEAALLRLRFDSASMMDSISTDLMNRAGASDAAGGLRLVAGASVADGKTAVIRGLPDRYVSSQLNGVRLPSADEDKRAVELDQFPAAVIESIQVSKTFTPDQQGDASGGAVNVKLKGIPEETLLQVGGTFSINTNVRGSDWITYNGGGLDFWGKDDKPKPQPTGQSWKGAVGVKDGSPPDDWKFSAAAGGKRELGSGVKIGGMASFFYERDSAFYDDGKNDSLWVTTPGGPLVPQTFQGTPSQGTFKTSLLDVTQASQLVKWGGLGTVGVEFDRSQIDLTYLYTRISEDQTTLAQDVRGKKYFFPGYDITDPAGPGNLNEQAGAAPLLRTETLNYTERTMQTLQLDGRHQLGDGAGGSTWMGFRAPEIDWLVARSSAELDQPDKTQFGSLFTPASFKPPVPPFFPGGTEPNQWSPYTPSENINLGNLQHIFKNIKEDSDQYGLNARFPFRWWGQKDGYMKVGAFDDEVDRKFRQETFSNPDDFSTFLGDFDDFWSSVFPSEDHPIEASDEDVDYDGRQKIRAYYSMLDVPVTERFSIIGGARLESTDIDVTLDPEAGATWFPPGSLTPVELNPGDGDVDFSQDDLLPAIGAVYQATDAVTLRASYSQTVARQTFKELTPILQQEYLGGPIFIGNPALGMSDLDNYDLRVDYTPYEGSLVSVSRFEKKVKDPIEYVQEVAPTDFNYTTAVNYPKGELNGYELEVRQKLGEFWKSMDGLAVGANATFINSEVTLSADEASELAALEVPITTRDMTNAPDHLYNFYVTWDFPTRTQVALFYTVTGDTLVAGDGESDGNYIPAVYAKEYGSLNLSVSQKIGERVTLQFQGKNLTNPRIQEVYRSDFINGDVTKTSYTRGREYSLGVSIRF
jgi:outer membrane receptor protein involved in Fe transport